MFYYSFKNRKNKENYSYFNATSLRDYNRIFTYSFYPAIFEGLMDGELKFLSIYLYLSYVCFNQFSLIRQKYWIYMF